MSRLPTAVIDHCSGATGPETPKQLEVPAASEVGETARCDNRNVVGAVDTCRGGALHVEEPHAERLEDPRPESRIVDEGPVEAPGAGGLDAWAPARIRVNGQALVWHALAERMRSAIPDPRHLYRQVPGRKDIVPIADSTFAPAPGGSDPPPEPGSFPSEQSAGRIDNRDSPYDTCALSHAKQWTGPAKALWYCRLNAVGTRVIRAGANRSDTVADSRRCPCALEEHLRS